MAQNPAGSSNANPGWGGDGAEHAPGNRAGSPDPIRALAEAAAAGGADSDRAFTRLVTLFRDRVVSVAGGMLGDADQAEDVAQEVFLKVHAKLHQFRSEARFDAWLYRITLRTAIDHTRRFWNRRRSSLETLPEGRGQGGLEGARHAGLSAEGREDPEATLLRAEQARTVRRALRELPVKYRAAVTLKDMADLSYEEIGRVLGCPLGTVESRIHRGRSILRKKLARVLER